MLKPMQDDPIEKTTSGRELWTIEGTNNLIRKLQNDPGLTEESRKEFIDSVRSGAVEKGIGRPEQMLNYRPSNKEVKVTQSMPESTKSAKSEPRAHTPKLTPEIRKKAIEQGAKERNTLLDSTTPGRNKPATSTTTNNDVGKSFDAYQHFTIETALYPSEVGIAYTVLGLNGESAETAGKLVSSLSKTILAADGLAVDEKRNNLYHLNKLLHDLSKTGVQVEKFKKQLRKGEKKLPPLKQLSQEEKVELAKEVGDVLWYCAQLSKCLGFKLSDIATMNVDKLVSRKARGVLHGNGDNR